METQQDDSTNRELRPSDISAGVNSEISSALFRSSSGLRSESVIPYKEAIRSLEKISSCTTPREKLQCLSESFSSLKTAVVDFHKGKVSFNNFLIFFMTIG